MVSSYFESFSVFFFGGGAFFLFVCFLLCVETHSFFFTGSIFLLSLLFCYS